MFFVVLGATLLPNARTVAAKLQTETVRAWERYVALTEARISKELESGDGFLVRDLLSPEQAEQCEQTIGRGGVCVTAMETRDKDGRAVGIPSGMVHHWMGSIFIPDVSLQDLSWSGFRATRNTTNGFRKSRSHAYSLGRETVSADIHETQETESRYRHLQHGA